MLQRPPRSQEHGSPEGAGGVQRRGWDVSRGCQAEEQCDFLEETKSRKELKTGMPWTDWHFRDTFLDLTRRLVRGKLAGSHENAIGLAFFPPCLPPCSAVAGAAPLERPTNLAQAWLDLA